MKNFAILFLFIFIQSGCLKPAVAPDPIPVYQSFSIASKIVNETRNINVWIPDKYSIRKDSFLVVYMLDGGIKEDFPHIANTLAALINTNKIPPVILVGIENTQRRRDLTGPTDVSEDKKIAPVVGGSAAFRQFINDELFPAVQSRYRCNGKKAIIGESLAGLFIIETFLENPKMFDYYIAMDPSLWWNDHYLVRHANQLLAGFPSAQKRLWYAGSKAKDINVYTDELAGIIKSINLPNLHWKYSDEPREKHNTIFRATKEKAFIWTLNPTSQNEH